MAKLIDLIVSGKSSFANDINAKNIYADKFATTGGTTAHVVRGDGTLQTIASLSVGNADTVDSQHANRFPWIYNSCNILQSTSVTCNDIAADANSNAHMGMIYSSTNNPTGATRWVHVWSQTWNRGVISSWVSQIALGVQDGTGMWYRTTSGALASKGWTRVIDSSNIGSQSVNYASSAGNADSVDGQHFNWNNNKNDHTYLWAASANGQAYLVHRASMSVNYANSAGSATKDSAGNTISSYYLPLSGGTMTGPIRSDSGYVILNPIGASYHTSASSVSGCITINLPASVGNTMVSMWIDVYIYERQKSFSVHCGGYTYNNSTWANSPFAIVYGANHRVRLGHNGTQFVIYIGETNTAWSYPQVSVRNVTLGFSPTLANWAKAWSVSFSTSVSNVTYDTTTYAWTTKNLAKSEFAPASHRHTKLHRRDSTSDYSVQHHWTGSYWYLRGYYGDSFHAEVQVGYANNAGSATIASTVTVNNSDSNSTYRMVWHSGNTLYSTAGIYCNPKVDSMYASFMELSRTADHGLKVGSIRGTEVGSRTGQYIHMYERVHIGSPNGWGSNDAPSYGLSTYGGAWLAVNDGNVGIGNTNPSYKLHVSGDSYTTGWSRAGSGFYVEGKGVHYMAGSASGIGQIYLNNNEFNWGASNANLYFNYRAATNGTTVTNYIWNAGSSSSYATHRLGSIHIHSNGSSYNESIRIHPSSGGWHAIVLCGTDNTGDSGVSANTWGIYGNSGTIYINKANSSGATNARAMGTSTGWTFGNTNLNSYALNAASFICASWVRTKGSTGWYNEDHGGGWYMSDTTYIRVHGSKRVYNDNSSQYAFYTAGGMTALGHMYSSSSACSWIAGQNATNAALNIGDATDTGSYWPWFRQTNTSSSKWFSVGTLSNSLYFIGSSTSRTANSYDHGFRMDFSNGYLYGNFSGYLSGTASNVTVNDSNADSTYRMVWHSGNILYSTAGIYCNPNTDAMYATRYYANASAGPHFTGTSAVGNWAYLRLNNSEHVWDIATRSNSGSGGLWLSRYAGGDNGIFVTASSTPKVGINTSSPSETLTVAGWVGTIGATGWYNITYTGGIYMSDTTWVRVYNNKKFYVSNSDYNAIHSAGGVYVAGMVHSYANYLKSTNNGKYIMIGPQNSSHTHYETDATTSHWFNKRVDVNGAIWRYGTNYGIDTEGYFYAKAVYANRDGSSTGGGVSLYSNSDPMTYGIAFRGTGSYGTKGRVQGDWATYLTMSDTSNRGWIFRRGSTNVASVSGEGIAYFEGVGRDTYIAYPGGATYTYGGGNITGALKITLPVKGCSTMMHMKITIYNYSGETSATYHVAGYNYSDGSWYNCTAYSLRQGTNGYGNLKVRFGNDGSKDCIYIGETSTTWSYPNVVVSDVLLGHSSQSHASWSGGWSVTVTTSLGNIKTTISNPAINNYVRVSDSNSNSTYRMVWHSGNELYSTDGIYCNPSSDYLYASSMQTSNWFRSSGNTGWYSQTYGGGWYMKDSSWIRSYGGHGVIAGGFYHSSYGSATYLLRSDGGVSAFTWSGQSGQPTWVWGGNSHHTYYVYNPSNFSVYKANKADQLEAYTGSGFTGGDHFVRAIRYDSWHTRLYMGYYRDTTLQNTIHVGYADNATYATSAGNADTVDGIHSNRFTYVYNSANYNGSSSLTLNQLAADGNSNSHVGMIHAGTDNPVSSSGNWVHVWSQSWTRGSISSWCSQIALGVQQGTGMWYRTTSGALTGRGWYRVIDSGNIGSQSVNYASSSGYASSSPAAANYGGTGNTTKIKIKINSTTSWMLSFVVTIYQGYKSSKIMVSGYNYGSNYWYEPEAVLLGDSNGAPSISVYFGYDSAWNLWVGFDGGSYTGVSISDVTNGYTQISSYKGLFTISNVSSLSTLQKTVSAVNHYAVTASKLSTSAAGSGIRPIYFSSGVPVASSSTVGAGTRGVYLSSGTITPMTYSLNATVSAGTASTLAYYSDVNIIASYTSTVGSKHWPMYLKAGVPYRCEFVGRGTVAWKNNSTGAIYCYQFGPIVNLQGYITKIGSLTANAVVFTLPADCPYPWDYAGITLSQKDGANNDRNTVIYGKYATRDFKVASGYTEFDPAGTNYYFSICYFCSNTSY